MLQKAVIACMRIITLLLCYFSIIATGLPLIQSSHWWIRIFDFPRAQIAVLCLLSIVLFWYFIGFRKKGLVVLFCLVSIAFVYQLALIVKYTPVYRVQAKAAKNPEKENRFTLVQANIRMDNKEAGRFLELVAAHAPDILLVNEPDEWWAEQIASLDRVYPHSIKKPQSNTYGMILYSRLALKNTEVNFLVAEDIPSMFATVVLPSGQEFDLHCLHPEPPKPGSPTYERDTEILLVGKRVKKATRPAMVVGDLNDVAWSHTSELFQRYSGLFDPREGRGLYNTYNAFIPLFRYPLDHFFYSEHFGLVSLKKLEAIGSDHFPILISLSFEPEHKAGMAKPKPDTNDIEQVEEKIQEGKEQK
jgi:endonuclease/exonuclease/phosphatase (EEP) superfamily protein YafD